MTSRKDKEIERLNTYLCPEDDEIQTFGVLLSDEIRFFVEKFKMIDPFQPENLKSASYRLTVGDEYSINGKNEKLSDETGKNKIVIQPFQVAIIFTAETINLPRFIIGRWNIQVKLAYKGLLWVGGPQVDPGWVGRLPCPIYNLSNKPVELKLNETIAVIDFVKTTKYNKGVSIPYPRPNLDHVLFEEYKPEDLLSGEYEVATNKLKILEEAQNQLKSNIQNKINLIERSVNSLGSRLDLSTTIVIAAIAALVTALSVFVVDRNVSQNAIKYGLDFWTYGLVIISIVCVFVTIGMYLQIKGFLKTISIRDDSNRGELRVTGLSSISNIFKNSIIQISSIILLLLIIALVIFTDLTTIINMKWQLLFSTFFLIVSILFGFLLSMKERSELNCSVLTLKRLTIIQFIFFIFSVLSLFWILLLKLGFL